MHFKRSSSTARISSLLLALLTLNFLLSGTLYVHAANGDPDADLAALVAKHEVSAGRLIVNSGTCLGFERDRNPANRLLGELKGKGLEFKKASACLKPPNGTLLTIGSPVNAGTDKRKVRVEVSDMNIEPGTHFATLRSRGVYTVAKEAKTGWVVLDYEPLPLNGKRP